MVSKIYDKVSLITSTLPLFNQYFIWSGNGQYIPQPVSGLKDKINKI